MHITQTWSFVIWPSTSCNLITRVLTVYHVKLTQNTALQQKCFDLQSLSPALPNLWLLLVINMIFRLSKVRRVRDQLLEAVWDKHRGFSTTHFLYTRGFSYMVSWDNWANGRLCNTREKKVAKKPLLIPSSILGLWGYQIIENGFLYEFSPWVPGKV